MAGKKKATTSASQAIAEAASKALDQTAALGSFLHKILGPGFEQLGLAFADWATVFRQSNALRLADKLKAIHSRRRLEGKTAPIPPRLAIPMLQQATLEDDETLQDMWAALIANATDPRQQVSARRVFVDLLSGMEPADAKALVAIHADEVANPARHPRKVNDDAPLEPAEHSNKRNVDWLAQTLGLTTNETAFSADNLGRLGLIEDIIPEGSDGSAIGVPVTHSEAHIGVTFMGRELLAACQT